MTNILVYLKLTRRRREKNLVLKCIKNILVYLKSPRLRRDKFSIVKCIDNNFSVPKVASPEARKVLNRKML